MKRIFFNIGISFALIVVVSCHRAMRPVTREYTIEELETMVANTRADTSTARVVIGRVQVIREVLDGYRESSRD
jgi:hypothetical protein